MKIGSKVTLIAGVFAGRRGVVKGFGTTHDEESLVRVAFHPSYGKPVEGFYLYDWLRVDVT